MRAVSLTLRREDGRIVCESVRVADTILRRMRGLLGRKHLPSDEGILLRPAWSIHTAFMRFPIDAVFIDPEQIVIRIEHRMRPFKTASCRGAREVVELAAGECERRGLEVGDRIAWASRSVLDDELSSENALRRPQPTAEVIVASDDQRFAKLARFLLDGRGLHVAADVRPTISEPRSRTTISTRSSSTPATPSVMPSGSRTPAVPTGRTCRSSSSAPVPPNARPKVSSCTTSGSRWTRLLPPWKPG